MSTSTAAGGCKNCRKPSSACTACSIAGPYSVAAMRSSTIRCGSASSKSHHYLSITPTDQSSSLASTSSTCACCHSRPSATSSTPSACTPAATKNSKEYFEAKQAIDRAFTEALWRSNRVDVYNINAPDYGEIDLQLDGVASWYLERREALHASKVPRRIAVLAAPALPARLAG